MLATIVNGSRAPAVALGYLSKGVVSSITTDVLFASKRSVVLGVPGAFTPVCSQEHVPVFVANASVFSAAGFHPLICVSPNDPFVLEAWQREVDPQSRLRFLSDGNLDFCDALGLSMRNTDLFLGSRSRRYMLIIDNNIIQRVRVESNILTYACTRAEDALFLDA